MILPYRPQIAVDGREAKEEDIVRQVRGSDIVGSKVVLTVRKGDCPPVVRWLETWKAKECIAHCNELNHCLREATRLEE